MSDVFRYIPRGCEQNAFAGKTLILPAISVGNVGQLATDLLIQTLKGELAGYIDTDLVLPFAGNDTFGEAIPVQVVAEAPTAPDTPGILSLALELFTVPEVPIVILQQRAPTVRRAATAYSNAISTWVKECGFSSVIVLASTEASRRRDFQLAGDQFRHFTTGVGATAWRDNVKEIGMKVLERVDGSVPEDSADVDTRDLQLLLHAGTTRTLYRAFKDTGVTSLFLMLFCSEGNNITEGSMMAQVVAHLLALSTQDKPLAWQAPSSWKGVMGKPVDPTLY